MTRIAVIYKSKYGSTKKYAEWVAGELAADIFDYKKVDGEKISGYDMVIFGGGLYAGSINGISLITKNFEALKDKNLVVFTVGLTSTNDKDIFKPIVEKNFTEEMRKKIQFFHFRGGIGYKGLSFMHKAMMAMLKTVLARKKPRELSDDDRLILSTYGDTVDLSDIKTIEPLVLYVNNLKKN